MASTRRVAIGIDLGTTYSCVSVVRGEKVEIIQNSQGSRTTSSCVAFTEEDGILVGDAARQQMAENPTNTIYSVKRLMGRRFDELHKNDLKYWPFKVKCRNEKPRIVVNYENATKSYRPQDISALVLKHMKEMAETFLGHTVKDAVISVPAYFNTSQREATLKAAKIARLNVLRIINEPTAAALAYGLNNSCSRNAFHALIFDLGGGTFDVTIMRIEQKSYTVKAVAGKDHLGGDDFDEKLVDYCATEFKNKYKLDLMDNPRALRRLRTNCDRAKRTLSDQNSAVVEVCYQGREELIKIRRDVFDGLCSDLFNTTITVVEQALKEAGMSPSEIDDIVLVGGSTRIPRIRQLLSNHFDGKQLKQTINPDEAVAYGAALQAAILSGNNAKLVQGIQLKEITPLSVGVEVVGGFMSNIIPRNTSIPCDIRKDNYTTLYDDQTGINIKVYQGESKETKNNHYLGQLLFENIQPQPKGVPKFAVVMKINMDGILALSAIDTSTNREEHTTIGYMRDLKTQIVNTAERKGT